MSSGMNRVVRVALWVGLVLVGGCGTRRVTDTPRTASEQLLVAASVDRAVSQLDLAPLAERDVYIDDSLVDRVDKGFVVATLRAHAWTQGVRVAAAAESADYILELRSGAVGLNRSQYVLGLPETSLPTPGGSLVLPEAPLYKSVKQAGATRISFVVYTREDRRFFYASGPAYGFSREQAWWVLGAGPNVRNNTRPRRRKANTATAPEPLSVSVPPPESPQQPPDEGSKGNDTSGL